MLQEVPHPNIPYLKCPSDECYFLSTSTALGEEIRNVREKYTNTGPRNILGGQEQRGIIPGHRNGDVIQEAIGTELLQSNQNGMTCL